MIALNVETISSFLPYLVGVSAFENVKYLFCFSDDSVYVVIIYKCHKLVCVFVALSLGICHPQEATI